MVLQFLHIKFCMKIKLRHAEAYHKSIFTQCVGLICIYLGLAGVVGYTCTVFGGGAVAAVLKQNCPIVDFCLSSQSSLIVILKLALLFCYSTETVRDPAMV